MNKEEVVIASNKRYKLTREGNRSDLYDFGAWFTNISGLIHGPAWRIHRKTLLFGWVRQSTTNDPRIVVEWKRRYFNNE